MINLYQINLQLINQTQLHPMLEVLKDDTEVYKQFVQNPSFKRFVTDMVFGLTIETDEPEAVGETPGSTLSRSGARPAT